MSRSYTRKNQIVSRSDYKNIQSSLDSPVFGAKEYKDNELAIEMLLEEKESAFAESSDLRNQLKDLLIKSHRLEVQKREFEIKLSEANNKIGDLKNVELILEDLKIQSQFSELNKRELEIKLDVANQKLDAIKKNAPLNFVITTVGAILFTLGTDVVTSHPDNWLAWIVAAAGVTVAFVAFFMSRRTN